MDRGIEASSSMYFWMLKFLNKQALLKKKITIPKY